MAMAAAAGAAAAVLVFAPARWLGGMVEQATGGRLRLEQARGTVWDGQARPVLGAGAGSREARLLPGTVGWQIRPAWRQGRPAMAVAIRQSCCMRAPLQVWLRPHAEGLELVVEPAPGSDEALGVWPAAWLTALGTPWNTLQPEGRLTLRANPLRVVLGLDGVPRRLEGSVVVQIDRASSILSTLPVLGSYRLSVEGPGPDAASLARLQLQTLDGALRLSAQGLLSPQGALRMSGQAEAEPGREAALDNVLNLIGRRDGARSMLSIGHP